MSINEVKFCETEKNYRRYINLYCSYRDCEGEESEENAEYEMTQLWDKLNSDYRKRARQFCSKFNALMNEEDKLSHIEQSKMADEGCPNY